jgi:hypothetical protein
MYYLIKSMLTSIRSVSALFLLLLLLIDKNTNAQNIGINNTGAIPAASAMLDVVATNRGLLIPRVALTSTADVATIATPATSLLVYNTATAGVSPTNVLPGYYYWDGVKWVSLSGGTGSNNWGLLGNAGTVAGTNFIGTTDAQDVVIKTNNINRFQLSQSGRITLNNPQLSNFIGDNGNETNTGQFNNAFGGSCLKLLTTGNHNNAFGQAVLANNTTGTGNTAMGHGSLTANTSGNYNSAYGYSSLQNNTTGYQNVAVGMWSLRNNTTGFWNVANGYNALSSNTIGNNNTANGYMSLSTNTSGNNNVAMGNEALSKNTTGDRNTSIGSYSLYNNTTGFQNVGVGSNSLQANTVGTNNNAFGHASLQNNTTGINNTAIGTNALISNTSGNYNTVVGNYIMSSNTTGLNNVAIGTSAGNANTTGNSNTYIGQGADASTNNLSNATAIGANAIVGASNSIVLGSGANVGIGTATPAQKLDVVGNVQFSKALMPNGAAGTAGQVLTSAGAGVAPTWINASTLPAPASAWNILGNSGTTAGTNFIGTTDAQDIVIKTNNIERMRVLSNGNVGIGATTPASKLTIENGNFQLGEVMGATATGRRLYFSDIVNSSDPIYFERENISGNISNLNLYIGDDYNSGPVSADKFNVKATNSSTPLLTVDAGSTFTGIGTTSPLAKLNVAGGAIRPEVGNILAAGINFGADVYGGGGDQGYIRYYQDGPGENTKLLIGNENDADDDISFYQVGGERMTIYNGNVGIGTTTPVAKLDLTGVKYSGAGTGTGVANDAPSQAIIPAGSGGTSKFNDWPSGWGGGLSTWDIVGGSTFFSNYITRSDRKLKEEIKNMDKDISTKLLNLRPVTYFLKEKTPENLGLQYGFIAQEVSELFPSIVTKTSDPNGTIGMNYQALIAPTIFVVQQQQQQIEFIKELNDKHDKEIQLLLNRIEILEKNK